MDDYFHFTWSKMRGREREKVEEGDRGMAEERRRGGMWVVSLHPYFLLRVGHFRLEVGKGNVSA